MIKFDVFFFDDITTDLYRPIQTVCMSTDSYYIILLKKNHLLYIYHYLIQIKQTNNDKKPNIKNGDKNAIKQDNTDKPIPIPQRKSF